MSKSAMRLVAMFAIISAFYLGTMLSERAAAPPAYSDADANNHWDHSGSNVFLAGGISRVGIGTTNPQTSLNVFGAEVTSLLLEGTHATVPTGTVLLIATIL